MVGRLGRLGRLFPTGLGPNPCRLGRLGRFTPYVTFLKKKAPGYGGDYIGNQASQASQVSWSRVE